MSRDNLETLRRYHDVLNESLEPPLELVHPDVEAERHRARGMTPLAH